jgi:hypothetical protein
MKESTVPFLAILQARRNMAGAFKACSCRPGWPQESPQHLLFHCPLYAKDRLAAAKSSRIPLQTKAFLYHDVSHKALSELLRNTRIGTRMERADKEEARRRRELEAERAGEVDEDSDDEDDDDDFN